MNVKALSFPCLLVLVLVPAYPAQESSDKDLKRLGQKAFLEPGSPNVRRVHELVERAASFDDLQSKATTLVNLADLLWLHKNEQQYCRQVMTGLRDDLKLALASESKVRLLPGSERFFAYNNFWHGFLVSESHSGIAASCKPQSHD